MTLLLNCVDTLYHIQDDSEALTFELEQQAPALGKEQALSLRRQNYSLMRDQLETKDATKYSEMTLFKKLLTLNKQEWWVILLGIVGAAVNGAMFPIVSVMFGGVFDAFAQPPRNVLPSVNPWASGFIVLAFTAGVAVLVKVRIIIRI